MINFISNITLIITLIVIYNFIIQKVQNDTLAHHIYTGILFGVIAILGMMIPLHISEGVIIDGRTIVISISGFFGGPITALFAVVIASFYRLSLGGSGTIVGVSTIVQSGIIGVLFYFLTKYKKLEISVKNILVFSLLVHLLMLISLIFIPVLNFQTVISELAIPILIIYPSATLIIALLIIGKKKEYFTNLGIKENEEKLKNIIAATNVGTWEWNIRTDEKTYSEEWAKILGYTVEELENLYENPFKELAHSKDYKKIEEIIYGVLDKKIEYYEVELRMKNRSGELIWVSDRGRVSRRTSSGKALKVVGSLIDITDRKKAEEDKTKELNKLKLIFENHDVMVLYIEAETGRILDANPSAINFYGYSESEMIQMYIQDINMFSKDKVKELMQKANSKSQTYFTFPHQLKSGEIRMVDVYSSPADYQGKEILLSIIFDVTKREEAMEEIKYLAYHDYLTGVYNRRYLEETFNNLNSEINYPLAFIMADINGLKLVNDTYGHKFGDEVIRKTSQIINSVIEDDGVLARIGGDEFGILIKNNTKDEIAKLTYDLEEALDLDITIENNVKIYLSVALGYAIMKDQESLDFLLSESEKHVFRRKYLNESSRHSHIIEAMMSTLFLKSEREQLHSKRVGDYSEKIAEALNWHKDRVNLVRVAGVLHDIGKIGIDESILNKEDKLNLDEWRLMLQHPVKSAKILEKIKEYKHLSQIVISHHERWDGKGYPSGIKKDKIPIETRIISVADAYDSMIEERPYKEKMTKEEAINELKKCSGSQFDPDIVDVFINKVLTKSDY